MEPRALTESDAIMTEDGGRASVIAPAAAAPPEAD